MNASERKRFAMAVGVLGETYGRQITEVTIRAYEIGMAGIPIQAIESAVNRAVTEKKFMPVPAELRELAGEMRPEDRAVKAWAAVQVAMRGHDYYDTVVFDDPVTTATVRHLWHDWIQFSEVLATTDEVWMRKDFERVYCSLMRTGIGQELTRPLIGFFERENALNGYREGDTVRGYIINSRITIACGLPVVQKLTVDHSTSEKQIQPSSTVLLIENIGTMPN